MISSRRGFTIVELLIVIVVIAILAAISVVAYNGIQARARDAQRVSDLNSIYKAVLNYQSVHGSLPGCAGYGYCASQPTNPANTQSWKNMNISPEFIANMPNDPINTDNQYGYYYARGYAKNTSGTGVSYVGGGNSFVLSTRLESSSAPAFTMLGNSSLNYVLGN